MAFELEAGQSVPKGIRRVVHRRIEKVLEQLDRHRTRISDDGVHDARKWLKQIRSALRLVRSELGERTFQRENRIFRDAGRPLSALRDATVLIESLDGLVAHFAGRVRPAAVATLRRHLVTKRRETRHQVIRRDHAIAGIVRRMQAAEQRVDDWRLEHRGWKAIEDGLRSVYAAGRRAARAITARASDDALHEWRKRAQHLRYALELLEPVWPATVRSLAKEAHRLSDLLGDDHDLALLRGIACESSPDDRSTDNRGADTEVVIALIDERRQALQHDARAVGERIYAETPRAFVHRLRGYWLSAS